MYTIQALWTAARHDIDAKFVVCNNGVYRLLQLNIDQYWKEQGIAKHDFPLAFDLSQPADPLRRAGAGRWACRPSGSRSRGRSRPAVEQALATRVRS